MHSANSYPVKECERKLRWRRREGERAGECKYEEQLSRCIENEKWITFSFICSYVNDDMNLLVLADGAVFTSCNRTTEKSQCAYKMKRSFMEWLQFYGNAHLFHKTLINSKRKFAKRQTGTEYAPDVLR